MPAGQSQPIDIDVKATLEADFKKAKAPSSRHESVISVAFKNVKMLYFNINGPDHTLNFDKEESLCRALAQLCKSSDSDKPRPCLRYENTSISFADDLEKKPSHALCAAWQGAGFNLEDANDKTLEKVHKELFFMAQITIPALKLTGYDLSSPKSISRSPLDTEECKVKMAEIDAYGAHLVQNADPKEQSSLKEQVEKIKSALQPFIA